MRCLAIAGLLSLCSPIVSLAASISGDYTIGCLAGFSEYCLAGTFQFFRIGPAASVTLDTPKFSAVADRPSYAFTNEHYDAAAFLSLDLHPDNLHAYASTTASILRPDNGVNIGWLSRGYVRLDVTSSDTLRFASDVLAAGSDVTFSITGILDSKISTTKAFCGDGPNAWAGLTISAAGSTFAPGTFYHSSCGNGSDRMAKTATFHSTVGADISLAARLQLVSDSVVQKPNSGSYTTTVDASNTALILVRVLTPGVTFSSASGATYAAPEPGMFLPLAVGLALLRRIRRAGI